MRLSFGKKSAFATPIFALAATSCCLELQEVRPPLDEGRGQPRRERSAATAWEKSGVPRGIGAGVPPEERVDLVLLGGDLRVQLGNGRGGAGQRALRPRRLELGHDAELEPVLERSCRCPGTTPWSAATISRQRVELDQLEVRLGDVADQRQARRRAAPPRSRAAAPGPPRCERRMLPHTSISHVADSAPRKRLLAVVGEVLVLDARGTRRRSFDRWARHLVADPGEERRARDQGLRPRLLDARGGDAQVVVAGERLPDQALERRVAERLPPGQIGQRRRLRGVTCPRNVSGGVSAGRL